MQKMKENHRFGKEWIKGKHAVKDHLLLFYDFFERTENQHFHLKTQAPTLLAKEYEVDL